MQQYNKVVCDEAVLTSTLAGRYPFQHSEWKAVVTTTGGAVDGELIRATFLSGGSVYTSHAAYLDALPRKATDIERGVILTDTEVAHNCEGIRLFVELDYRTATQLLPTWDEAVTHIRLIARTVLQEAVRRREVYGVVVVATLLIWYAFYKLLRVPLPWGWLTGMAF